jgi:hypothetical protein
MFAGLTLGEMVSGGVVSGRAERFGAGLHAAFTIDAGVG